MDRRSSPVLPRRTRARESRHARTFRSQRHRPRPRHVQAPCGLPATQAMPLCPNHQVIGAHILHRSEFSLQPVISHHDQFGRSARSFAEPKPPASAALRPEILITTSARRSKRWRSAASSGLRSRTIDSAAVDPDITGALAPDGAVVPAREVTFGTLDLDHSGFPHLQGGTTRMGAATACSIATTRMPDNGWGKARNSPLIFSRSQPL